MRHDQNLKSIMNCNLCGSDDISDLLIFENAPMFHGTVPKRDEYKSPKRDLKIGFCRKCSLIFQIDPLTPEEMDNIYSHYSHPSATTGVSGGRVIEFLEFIEDETISKGGKALEIGCLDGFFLHLLKQKGNWDVYGCDPAPMIKIAQDKYGIKIEQSIFRPELYQEKNFDMVVMRNLLEHILDPTAILKDISKILKDEGIIAIEVPNAKEDFKKGVFSAFHWEHLYYFTETTLKLLLKKTGFSVTKMDAIPKVNRLHALAKKSSKSGKSYLGEKGFKNLKEVSLIAELSSSYRDEMKRLKEEFISYLNAWKRKNAKVVIWGAGGHTQYLIPAIGLTENDLAFIVDKDSSKQDRLLSGFSLEVKSPSFLKESNADVIIVSSYEYQDDIIRDIRDMNLNVKILKIYPHVGYIQQ